MLSLSEAWGTKFFPTAVAPKDLTTMIFASAMNLTGARSLSESAFQQNCNRAASIALPFAEAAAFVQRSYNLHPDYRIVVLGQSGVNGGVASHAVVTDAEGCIVFDTYATCRASYFPGMSCSYNGPALPMQVSVLHSISYQEAYGELQQAGLWKTNAWSWDKDMPRGTDYL